MEFNCLREAGNSTHSLLPTKARFAAGLDGPDPVPTLRVREDVAATGLAGNDLSALGMVQAGEDALCGREFTVDGNVTLAGAFVLEVELDPDSSRGRRRRRRGEGGDGGRVGAEDAADVGQLREGDAAFGCAIEGCPEFVEPLGVRERLTGYVCEADGHVGGPIHSERGGGRKSGGAECVKGDVLGRHCVAVKFEADLEDDCRRVCGLGIGDWGARGHRGQEKGKSNSFGEHLCGRYWGGFLLYFGVQRLEI